MNIFNHYKLFLAAILLNTSYAFAQNFALQSVPVGSVSTSLNVNAINQFNTNIGSGGSFNWQDANVHLNSRYQLDANSSIGLNLRDGYQNWSWSNVSSYGNKTPWRGIQSPGVGLSYFQKLNNGWSAGFAPIVDWVAENGVGTAGSATYGAIGSGTKRHSDELTIGLGTGVFRQVDKTKVFPYLLINWKITDKWTLNNPLPAGPSGGAGLELSYALADKWSVAGGAAYRSYRFRLSNSNYTPNGIGQNSFIPIFTRLSYSIDKGSSADLYLATNTGGKLSVTNVNGATAYSSGYSTGIAAALSITTRF
jgi:Domain of unknown function (DUF6268)